jgi:hypothetical protein
VFVGCLLLSHVFDDRARYRTVECRLVLRGIAIGGQRLLPGVVS